jgi:hypothetical protein
MKANPDGEKDKDLIYFEKRGCGEHSNVQSASHNTLSLLRKEFQQFSLQK